MNLLLVSKDVPDFQVFLDAANENTRAVLYSPSMTQAELLESIQMTSAERIAVVSRKEDRFVDHKPVTESEELFKSMIQTLGVKTIDFLACNTLKDPRWTQFYTSLGVTVGASNDLTGNLKYGGDWMMESTGEDIEKVYFTQSIEYYKYLLDVGTCTLFVKKNGTLLGAGYNNRRQLGIDSTTDIVDTFQPITKTGVANTTKIDKVKQIACGFEHTMLLLEDGTLLGAGNNGFRQLGIDSPTDRVDTFQPITKTGVANTTKIDKVKQIACGYEYTMLLLEDGTLLGAGNNGFRQLGIDSTSYSVDTFQPITRSGVANTTKIDKVKYIACGFGHTMLLLEDGTLLGAGSNGYRQLGVEETNPGGYFADGPYNEGYVNTFTEIATDVLFIQGQIVDPVNPIYTKRSRVWFPVGYSVQTDQEIDKVIVSSLNPLIHTIEGSRIVSITTLYDSIYPQKTLVFLEKDYYL